MPRGFMLIGSEASWTYRYSGMDVRLIEAEQIAKSIGLDFAFTMRLRFLEAQLSMAQCEESVLGSL